MTAQMGWLSIYYRRGEYRWRVHGADGAVLARGADSHTTQEGANQDARRVSALLASVFELADRAPSKVQ